LRRGECLGLEAARIDETVAASTNKTSTVWSINLIGGLLEGGKVACRTCDDAPFATIPMAKAGLNAGILTVVKSGMATARW
jgi:hypothetical protein